MNTDLKRNFKIYRSSAGSGKTYQLALEYISLAIKNPAHFDKILAVTFTNKATKEMKDRILHFLISIAESSDDNLTSQLHLRTGLSEHEIAKNSKILISRILHHYSGFSVSTIDAFFQKVVKSFARELGLLGNYSVELDLEMVKQEIIDRLIDEVGSNELLTGWLIDFSYYKVDDNRSWNIRPQIEILADEIFKDSFIPIEKELSKIQQEKVKICLEQLLKIKGRFEHKLKAEATQALELISRHGLSIDDFSYKSSGPAGYFGKILHNNFVPGKRFEAAVEDHEKWCSKSSNKKNEVEAVLAAGLQEVAQRTFNFYKNEIVAYTSANEVLKNIYVFGILAELSKKLKSYRIENDIMMISDVSVFLKEIIAENDAPFIYEKVGAWYRNYLIDEFQDTSNFQWNNFKPLIENSLAQGNLNLIVGDGKQSIYRWRGGDWNLLLNQAGSDFEQYRPDENYLSTNWRSSKKIVDFNNAMFDTLPKTITAHLINQINEAPIDDDSKQTLTKKISKIEELYNDVKQEIAQSNADIDKGFIEINAYQKNESVNWKEKSIEKLIENVEHLQANGYRASDIAVLTRRGDEGQAVLQQLLQYKKSEKAITGVCYDAISNESLFLGNSPAIRLIIQTINYCQNPDDKIALAEISYNYSYLQNNDNSHKEFHYVLSEGILPADFYEVCKELKQLPVYQMIERIIQLFGLGKKHQVAYLQALQDVVLEYFSNEKTDINEFLEWWKDKGQKKSILLPENINAIQVMTIHKSKGLEFKAVLLPFCDWNLDHEPGKNNFIWCRSDQDPFAKLGFFPVKYSKELVNSYFSSEFFDEKIKAHIDNLNLIYVALTRAAEFLMINCPPKGGTQVRSGDLVVSGIEHFEYDCSIKEAVKTCNDSDFVINYSIGDLDNVQSEHMDNPVLNGGFYKSSSWREKISLKKKGGLFLSEEGKQKKEKINYGILVHEILERIKNEKEAELLVNRYYLEGQISKEDKNVLINQLEKIFANSQINSWFNTDWKVKVESSIILKNQHPKRPDRVLMKEDKAIIIDFKTGAEKPQDKNQLRSYIGTLRKMGFQKIEAFLLYIANNKVVQVA